MQRRITNLRRSDDEVVKEGGLLLDFDEIAPESITQLAPANSGVKIESKHRNHLGNFPAMIGHPVFRQRIEEIFLPDG